ncbi:MAG TPA: molybdopterin-dependent oxidoreductase [Tenuifilaceae bacterium]|jgi:aldehyde oxidoreductase|nr:molybdopterin-dependent oxidoreductase [Bacteroidales bacterium]MDI9516492.1 molybdopterin-dependent oxidoreductase [Bacteroidota bacterium]NLH56842.1 molybdopterin-dependent oxidoreductase [Rikenellaceae bacterium]OQC62422.1 MAG: Aldehyde oxidoreductase [Bacteroidetes bacterium ADurb.Bin008]HNV81829.1 molybdopterin-dependent oxidoreductase [Tenuifilaceae bacterium]
MKLKKMWLNINGANRMFACNPEKDTLADVVRRMGLTGTKIGCGTGVCGSCTLILNGKLTRSCTKKMKNVEEYSSVITIEGIGTPTNLHPIQAAWMVAGAVQCGFCTPGFIVSSYALLLENPKPTREEVREWFHKNKNVCRCTGYVQIVDAVMLAAEVMRGEKKLEDIYFKNPKDGEFYGKPVLRPSALAKVCGLADYGDDQELKMPAETLKVAMVQPKVAHHAKILKIDTSEAEKMPGVVKIITAKDIKAAGGTNVMAEGHFFERTTLTVPTRNVLCEDKIYRYGDVVALVCADTKDNARAAAAKVKVEIEKLPEYLSYLDAVMPSAQRIHPETPNIFAQQPVLKGVGLEEPSKVSEVIENSDFSVEGSFHSTREPHLSIEGDTVQAYFDEDGMLAIQCKSQGVYSSIGRIGNSIGIPRDKIRIIMNPTGASFGWSTNAGDLCLAAAAAFITKMPIALSMSYEEHQHFSGKRRPSHSNGRAACDKNGKLTAVEFDYGLDQGPYTFGGDDIISKPARFAFFPYVVPNVAGLSRIAITNHNFGTAYRSYGSPQAYTLSEALIDMLAEKAGIDPFEFRWRNIAREGELNINSCQFRLYPMEEMMKMMKPYYDKAVKEAKEKDTPEVRRGVGLSWGGFNVSEGPTDHATVRFELNPDNTVTKYDTWQDLGQGGDVGSLMVALEALKPLKLTPEQIKLVQSDTKICPDSGMSAGSRSHYMNGNATIVAAGKLLEAMRKPDGTYRTYDEMVKEGIPTVHEGKFSNINTPGLSRLDPNTGIGDPTPAFTYALNLAEVAVETATGKTTVTRFVCVADVGKIGNIDAVKGQAFGGISHSIGFALSENYDDVKKHTNIASSGVPYNKDIPDSIITLFHESTDKHGPFGSSGASEAFQSSGHMAVINAINNATGVRIYELPATKEKVKEGLDILAKGGKINPPKKYFLGSDLYDELENIKANPVPYGGIDFFKPMGGAGERFF